MVLYCVGCVCVGGGSQASLLSAALLTRPDRPSLDLGPGMATKLLTALLSFHQDLVSSPSTVPQPCTSCAPPLDQGPTHTATPPRGQVSVEDVRLSGRSQPIDLCLAGS